jgi:hypothetical protein
MKKKQPLTKEEADMVRDWAKENQYPGFRDDRGNPDSWEGGEHIHLPGAGRTHIPVGGGWR